MISRSTTSVSAPSQSLLEGGQAHPAQDPSNADPITIHAQITVKDLQDVEITLKPEEKIRLIFMEVIASMEDDCSRHLSRKCSLAELVAGPKSPDWNIGKLKYDSAQDPNYKYTVTITGCPSLKPRTRVTV